MARPNSWFHDALTASVAALGHDAATTLGMLRMLPVDAARNNVAQGLLYAASRGRDLWPHQVEATGAIRKHLLAPTNDPTAIVVMPTGSGKTEIILRTVEASGLDAGGVRIALPTVLLVPTRQLVEQTLKAFTERFPSLHVAGLGEGAMVPASVTIMTYDLFVDMLADGRLEQGDMQALVMDEAHRGLSDLRQELIGELMNKVVLTAYSATPAFDAIKNVHALLGARNEVVRISDERMRKEGVISPVVDYVLRVGISGNLPSDRDERAGIVRKACENAILDFLAGETEGLTGIPLRDKTYLAYTNGIARAQEMARTLSAMGMKAESVSGRDSTKIIRSRLDDIAAGRIQALVNDQILTEGTNIPEARGVMAFSPTTSVVKHLQRCGRARRIDPRFALDDPRQVTSVIETLVEVNGKVIPGQKIYADAIGDVSVVKLLEGRAQSIPDLIGQVRDGRRRSVPDSGSAGGGWVATSGDLDSVHYFLANRDTPDYPPCPDDHISWHMLAKSVLASNKNSALTAVVTSLEEALREGRPTSVSGIPVRAGLYRLASGYRGVCIHRDDTVPVRDLLGNADVMQPWEEGWLPIYAVAEKIGTTRGNPKLREIWDAALAGTVEVPPAPDGGPGIRLMRYHSHRVGYAHPNVIEALSKALGLADAMTLERKGDHLVPYTTLCRRYGAAVHNKDFRNLWNRIVEAYERDGKVEMDGRTLGFGMYRTVTNKPSYCLAEADVEWFVRKTGWTSQSGLSKKPDDWLNKAEVAAALGVGDAQQPYLNGLWTRLAATKGMTTEEAEKWGGRRFAGESRRVGQLCLHIDKLDDLRRLLFAPKEPITEDWYSLHRMCVEHVPDTSFRRYLKRAWRDAEAAMEAGHGTGGYRFEHRDRITSPLFCLHADDVGRYLEAHAPIYEGRKDDSGWLAKSDAIDRLAGSYRQDGPSEAWDLLLAMAEDGPVTDGDRVVAFEMKGHQRWKIHESEIGWFAELAGVPIKKRKDPAQAINSAVADATESETTVPGFR